MNYSLSAKARDDMLRLYVDGVKKHGTNQAEKYWAGLVRQFEALSHHPELYPKRPEIQPPIRICPYGVHVIVYRIESPQISIIRIRHGREDWHEG